MQIIIDVPEDEYNKICSGNFDADGYFKMNLKEAFRNAISLPKGHGRLIDADEYKEHLYACEINGRPLHTMELDERLATVDDAPTIIEADKE